MPNWRNTILSNTSPSLSKKSWAREPSYVLLSSDDYGDILAAGNESVLKNWLWGNIDSNPDTWGILIVPENVWREIMSEALSPNSLEELLNKKKQETENKSYDA